MMFVLFHQPVPSSHAQRAPRVCEHRARVHNYERPLWFDVINN